MGEPEAVIRTENRLKELYPQLSIARSKPVYLEVMNGKVRKSAGAEIVCERYNISMDEANGFPVTDKNDLDMLNAVGAGFAMAECTQGSTGSGTCHYTCG